MSDKHSLPVSSEDVAEPAVPSRRARTNLLLSATIEADGVAGPVRIRNLSEEGALLEGAALPPVGAGLVLRRLQLQMGATVIWTDRSRCGVRFEGSISVAGWREGNWIAPVGHAGQMRVDGIQAALRSGQPLPQLHEVEVEGAIQQSKAEIDARIADELTALQTLLEDLGAQLADAPAIAAACPAALQQFDLAVQTLGHLSQVVRADDRRATIAAIGMEQLRLRLQGAVATDRPTTIS